MDEYSHDSFIEHTTLFLYRALICSLEHTGQKLCVEEPKAGDGIAC